MDVSSISFGDFSRASLDRTPLPSSVSMAEENKFSAAMSSASNSASSIESSTKPLSVPATDSAVKSESPFADHTGVRQSVGDAVVNPGLQMSGVTQEASLRVNETWSAKVQPQEDVKLPEGLKSEADPKDLDVVGDLEDGNPVKGLAERLDPIYDMGNWTKYSIEREITDLAKMHSTDYKTKLLVLNYKIGTFVANTQLFSNAIAKVFQDASGLLKNTS